jgi:hypothetical protein
LASDTACGGGLVGVLEHLDEDLALAHALQFVMVASVSRLHLDHPIAAPADRHALVVDFQTANHSRLLTVSRMEGCAVWP